MAREPESRGTPTVLVTGATGDIGGRLVPVREAAGVRLRCLTRRPAALEPRVAPTTEVVSGDLVDPASPDRALFPFHTLIFGGVLRAIARRALSRS